MPNPKRDEWLEETASMLRLFHSALALTDLSKMAEYQRAVTRAHGNIEKGLEKVKALLGDAVLWRASVGALTVKVADLTMALALAKLHIEQLDSVRQSTAARLGPNVEASGASDASPLL